MATNETTMDDRDSDIDHPLDPAAEAGGSRSRRTPLARAIAEAEAAPGHGAVAKLILLAAIVAFGYFSVSFGTMMMASYRLGREESALRQQIVSLQEEHQSLLKREAGLKTDDGIERLAREQLGMVRPGDTPVRLVRPVVTPAPPVTPTAVPTPRADVDRLWDWLRGR